MGAELAQSPFSGDSGGQAAARPELSLNSTSRAHAKAKPEDEGQAGDQLSVAEVAEQILKDPENTARMQRVTDAAQRVAELQAESGRLAAAMAEAEVASAAGAEQREREAQASAAALIADAEVAAAEKLLQAAQLQAQSAEAAKGKWAGDINEDAERLESAKAAAAAGAAGALASLPLVASDGGGGAAAAVLALATAGVASALLGVTYRYAVCQDLANTQLKAGVVAAFGLVRGLGQANGILAGGGGSNRFAGLDLSLEALGGAGLALGQCMLVAAFAATAVEAGMQRGLVKPFGAAADGSGDGAGSP
ncbi:hypothetical protein CHLNCDRAFT_142515 [Chlorella variabilis]|uniref:Uncharacterized protein n=1 Tax=Chlorella variabilis TaxID=554065 RepID=E1ZTT6_CHLVA|nr:hypothetical protein CHLNCDRAFT_142515 [Chlorella variabilis]EFN50766.1 hypothetical protein CHLNCDRAFT_142515 [Chlorella variabilis]|eukprot:XP_005842878.1 hypothetical protein CHLNCDRAFT_142515 [Chlorella variabilis]